MERDYMGDDAEPVLDLVIDPAEPIEHNRLEQLLRGIVHTIMATRRVAVAARSQPNARKRLRRYRRDRMVEACKPLR